MRVFGSRTGFPKGASYPTAANELELLADGYRWIAGADEVGRGCWAGPLVAAAVVLPEVELWDSLLEVVRDSKSLSSDQRSSIYPIIMARAAAVSLGVVSPEVINRIGLQEANLRAIADAVANLRPQPDFVLIDHMKVPQLVIPSRSITKGDAICLSIAAASIVAKVTRDRMMMALDEECPGYGFASNKGYGTKAHRAGLAQLGVSPIHRRSFAPIRRVLEAVENLS